MKVFAKTLLSALTVAVLMLTGCATMPTPTYITTDKYQSYDCGTLASEYNRIDQYVATAPRAGGLRSTGIGIGIGAGRGGIYPSISMGVGSGGNANKSNLALAMGERDAVIQSARLKRCAFANTVKVYGEK